MDWDSVDAALFDLDGVLTPTAEVHMRVSSPPVGGVQPTKYAPMLGVITMLPALRPT